MPFLLEQIISLDFWTFVVAFLALVATVWLGREQLKLARKEAERHPILRVSAMHLTDATEVYEIMDTAKERKEWLNELASYELAKQQYEKQRKAIEKQHEHSPLAANIQRHDLYKIAPQDPSIFRLHNEPLLFAKQDYDGPFPDMVLRVTLVNKGKVAALDISGQLYVNSSHLEPLDFPGLDGQVEPQDDGVYQVNVSTYEGSRLLPAPTDEELTFDIAILVKKTGTTHIQYAFATPQGDHVENSWLLNVSSRKTQGG